MMTQSEQQKLFEEAIEKWGKVAQIDMLLEETTELQLELHRIKRNRNDGLDNLAQEMADTYIMLAQMQAVFKGTNLLELVESWVTIKLARLKIRVESK